ncbi:MAG: hypothetical protein J6R21_08820, partial [Bacteroidales bacterium]|nr:hypothetical protein [Bacteroidales bacterium]
MQDLQKINFRLQTADEIPQALNQADCPWHQIAQCNWPEKFPYRPKVAFRIAYTDDALLLHYRVEEECIMALAEDNGPIWTDSCVECFISPAEDGYYYNIEANCIGNMLIGCGQSRHDRERGDKEVRDKVLRWSGLG